MAEPKYEIIERIGAGGMAEVFKASSTSLEGFEKLVAIKRVLPELTENERFTRMFLDEAKIALPLNHTNIVQTFDLGRAGETYFIVMEFVDGTNLKEVLSELSGQRKFFGVGEVAHIALEICKGLAHAHTQRDAEGENLGIVHRDISPPNILLSRDGEVKITDFGLAKAKSQAEITDPDVVKGKFGYLSPEAAQGEEVDHRTDLFAVGILMWEMLTGERLFMGESDYETLQMVRETDIPRIAEKRDGVPEALRGIVMRALAADPNDRYQTARELAEALAEFTADLGRPVTDFNIADYVRAVVGEGRAIEESDTSLDAAGQAVQREINQFVSIEEIGELDLHLAQQNTIGEESADFDPEELEDKDFEDPRAWDDVGLGGDELDVEGDAVAADVDESDEWQEQQLSDVARATQSMKAIDDEAAEASADNVSKPKRSTLGKAQQGERAATGAEPDGAAAQRGQGADRSGRRDHEEEARERSSPDPEAGAPVSESTEELDHRRDAGAPTSEGEEGDEATEKFLVWLAAILFLAALVVGAFVVVMSA